MSARITGSFDDIIGYVETAERVVIGSKLLPFISEEPDNLIWYIDLPVSFEPANVDILIANDIYSADLVSDAGRIKISNLTAQAYPGDIIGFRSFEIIKSI